MLKNSQAARLLDSMETLNEKMEKIIERLTNARAIIEEKGFTINDDGIQVFDSCVDFAKEIKRVRNNVKTCCKAPNLTDIYGIDVDGYTQSVIEAEKWADIFEKTATEFDEHTDEAAASEDKTEEETEENLNENSK